MIVSKYHGCGNDFIIGRFDDLQEDPATFAIHICDRHTGIGADGLILVKEQPLEMVFYNCDGSRAPMCGNGIRVFARFVQEENICTQDAFDVVTLAGKLHVCVIQKDPFLVQIQMGKVSTDTKLLHTKDNQSISNYTKVVQGQEITIDSCFMGTIHTMVVVDDALDSKWIDIGEELHKDPIFEEKTNVNFTQVIDEHTMIVQTYERGVGMTKACGTGCCASVWNAWKKGLVQKDVRVQLEKGYLDILIDEDDVITMSGPAQLIMKGANVC